MTIDLIFEGAEETLAIEATGRKGLVIKAVLGVVSDIRQMVAQAIQHFGLDILVNNAGLEKNAAFKGSDRRRL